MSYNSNQDLNYCFVCEKYHEDGYFDQTTEKCLGCLEKERNQTIDYPEKNFNHYNIHSDLKTCKKCWKDVPENYYVKHKKICMDCYYDNSEEQIEEYDDQYIEEYSNEPCHTKTVKFNGLFVIALTITITWLILSIQ
ncbi:hypothetical protein [Bacillus cereus]|uniref:hypothetical protein n=1 Tax=Bacillus cereus TaxID=1396 RepID=UPI000B4B04B0|nr:hypothetical protein [Bacillus cereus]